MPHYAGTNGRRICRTSARFSNRDIRRNDRSSKAIRINVEAYPEAGQALPECQSVEHHLENPEFQELVFAYVEVPLPTERIAA